MIISDAVFQRMKEEGIQNGVFLFVSNNKNRLREEAPAFAHSLLDYTAKDVALNEKIFVTDGDYISADMANQFIEFEAKAAVGVPSKILIMHDVELCKDNVSDKLLKVIEDYHSDSLIVFTSSALESVSRTIRSRCMVFKEFSDEKDFFLQFRNKYLGFIEQTLSSDYSQLQTVVEGMINLGSLNIIQAMFANLTDAQELEIAKRALSCILSGSKDTQINQYLVYSFWCLHNGLRRWDNAHNNSGK